MDTCRDYKEVFMGKIDYYFFNLFAFFGTVLVLADSTCKCNTLKVE